MPNETKVLKDESETEEFAQKLAKEVKRGDALAFYGDLGSGKTTFINYLARAMGIKRRLISPTFVIHRVYERKDFNFHHIDLYRIRSEKEIVDIGILDLFEDPKNIIAIEWAEKMEKFLPKRTVRIYLEYIDENKRELRIER